MKKENKLAAFICGALIAGYTVKRLWKQHYNAEKSRGDSEEKLKQLYYNWLLIKQKGVSLADCLREEGIANVAVLGLDPPGRRFIDELEGSGITVVYAIEHNNPSSIHEKLEVYRLGDDTLPETDAVVVCTLRDFLVIQDKLKRETKARVIALEDLISKTLKN